MICTICRGGTGPCDPRISDDERDARGFFVSQAAFLVQSVLAVEVAVVAREDHHRVVELAHLAQRSHDTRETLIDAEQHLEPVADVRIGCAGLGSEWS